MPQSISRATVVALSAMAAAAPALGQQLIDGSRPERILAVAKGFGMAELGKDKRGDPQITGRMDGTRYVVAFYGCKDGKACRAIQFFSVFEVAKKPTLDAINAYNAKNRFAKVYVDKDGDPIVELDVNLDGGISQKNLDDTFDWWKLVLRNMRKTFVEG